MKQLLGIIAIALHVGLLISLFQFSEYPLWLSSLDFTMFCGEPRVMHDRLVQAASHLGIGVGGGLVGVFLAWFTLRKEGYTAKWFVASVRLSVVPWLVLIPIGPLLALFMIRITRTRTLQQAAT